MLRKLNLTKRQGILYLLIPGIFVLCGVFWYSISGNNPSEQEQQVSKNDPLIRIKQDTKIDQTVFFVKCKDQTRQEVRPKESESALTYPAFQALYPAWNIETFSEEKVVMSLQMDAYCKEHLEHMFIGRQGDYVAVFYGKPGQKPMLKEMTKIPMSGLHPQAAEEVSQGIVFQSKEEMLQILEGLHSR